MHAGSANYTVSITRDPSTGPFQLNTAVSFHCSVAPVPPEPVTYSWRSADPFIYSSIGQNYTLYIDHREQHFSWLHCEVFSNSSTVGNARTFIELQGKENSQGDVWCIK